LAAPSPGCFRLNTVACTARKERITSIAALIWVLASTAAAQPAAPAASQPAARAASIPPALPTLPVADLFAVLETMQAEVVSDRFNSGGLNVSAPSRTGGFLTSWAQTRYQVGHVDLSSSVDGTPLVYPSLAWWRDIDIDATLLPVDTRASGLAVALTPYDPQPSWTGVVEGFFSGGRLAGPSRSAAPVPVATLDGLARGNGIVSGPLSQSVRLAAGAEWSRASVDTPEIDLRRQRLASLFNQMVFTPSIGREIRVLSIVQHTSGGNAAHAQASVESSRADATRWHVYGAGTYAARKPHQRVRPEAVERLADGPVPIVVADRQRSERQWTAGAGISPQRIGRHELSFGAELSHAGVEEPRMPAQVIRETVDGQPARQWMYTATDRASVRSTLNVSAFARTRLTLSPRWLLDAAVRLDHVSGRAKGALDGISWTGLSPAVHVSWDLGTGFDLRLRIAGRRTFHRLLSEMLTVGDPASPTADVYRWEPNSPAAGPLVARVGPGAGSGGLSAIDPELRRPETGEFVIGLESGARQSMRLSVMGVARRQSGMVQLANIGVTPDSYRSFAIADPNADLVNPDDDQQLIVYDRLPTSFGQDKYLLTNSSVEAAKMGAVVIAALFATDRLSVSIAATAAASVGDGGSRGFRVFENDPDVLGETRVNPNASTNSRGRLFSDRAYTIKSSIGYRLPAEVAIGIIARYQDGQPFTRLVVVPGLSQGVEAVQAFPRGRSRFAFTGTLDLRLQKRIRLGGNRLDVIVDVYNLPNMRKETEEYVVTGPRFRESIAVQPPRSIHFGMRASF
jgi:hypothetical protein